MITGVTNKKNKARTANEIIAIKIIANPTAANILSIISTVQRYNMHTAWLQKAIIWQKIEAAWDWIVVTSSNEWAAASEV